MKSLSILFWIVMTGVVIAITLRTIVRGDASASGVSITRRKTPVRFWIWVVADLLACALLTYVVVLTARKAAD